jgi:catechol 2,3-dioxygenase-like lactoylglutathione lyase family enzyme
LNAQVLFAGLPVTDIRSALEWYRRFFDAEPDLTPHEGERVWRVTETGWIYVVEDRDRAGRGLATVMVDDLAQRAADLHDAGIEIGEIEKLGGGTLKAVVTDPDGNQIGLGQVPDA